jgi:sulfur-oxidizing protein SoxA
MGPAAAQQRLIPLSELRSGLSYAGADVRALQADEFGNPAQLWLMRGEQRWSEAVGAAGKSCQSCHGTAGDSMRGVAARYPALSAAAAS